VQVASVRSDVLDIAYTQTGRPTGPPVILIHGWPDTARGWRQVAAGLASAGWRVIMPDNRGTGSTRFLSADTVRDGQAVALAQDTLDLADGLGIARRTHWPRSYQGASRQLSRSPSPTNPVDGSPCRTSGRLARSGTSG
jgi:pimeloyl-ACP methyl ester carboxylesterase